MSRLTAPRTAWAAIPGTVLLLLLPFVAVRAVSDPSPWLHLKVGQFLLEGHRFVGKDPWAPYAHGGYVATQWLPSVAMAWMYDLWGTTAISWARGVGVVLFAFGLMYLLTKVCRPWLAAAVASLGLLGAWPWLTERPQLLGFVLLIPVVGAWWQSALDHRPRWWLVPVTWSAACVHGVWFMGLALGGVVVLGLVLGREQSMREGGRLIGVLTACAVAAALTPLGPGLLLSPFDVGSHARQFVAEWMPSSVRTPSVALVLVMLVGTWCLWLRARRKPAMWQLMWFAAAVILCLAMQRTVPVAAIVAAFLLAETAEEGLRRRTVPWLTQSTGQRAPTQRLWSGAVALSIAVAAPLAVARGERVTGVPVALEPRLQQLPPSTRVLAYGDATGWLMFVAPQVSPVFDLRIEQYSPDLVRDYISTMRADAGWQRYVSATHTRAALLLSDSALASALVAEQAWRVTARDHRYVLLEAPQ